MYVHMSLYTYGVRVFLHVSPRDHNKLMYVCIYDMSVYTYGMCMCTFPPRDCNRLTYVYMCYVSTYTCVCIQVLNIHRHTLTTAQRHSQHSLKFSLISLMLFLSCCSFLPPPCPSLAHLISSKLTSGVTVFSSHSEPPRVSSGVPSSCCSECLMGSLLFWLSWLALSHLLL